MHRRILLAIFFLIFFALSNVAHAATLSLSPSSGTFSVGSTFDVSIFLDTNGKSVNALAVSLQFPADMLQVVSPSLGQSIIGVWTSAPRFDNAEGRIDLQGGIPGGITASNALISTMTFRIKSVGSGIVKFLDGSKVLLNDGLGTNALSQTSNAVFSFKLPPPAGPALASETNPDQAQWYKNRSVSFRFMSEAQGVQGYSYTLSDDPTTVPDNINLGTKNVVTYQDLPDGIHFFHVKSLRDGAWGGTTHYSVKIDSTKPADFKINVSPGIHTSNNQPIILFSTSDAFSGIDHYEMKIVPLSINKSDSLFTEVISPYISPVLEKGSYDVIVRAFDKAHNYQEVVQRIFITQGFFSLVDSGGFRMGTMVIQWPWFIAILLILLGAAAYVFFKTRQWHIDIHIAHTEKKLPERVDSQLEQLKKYRAKYGAKKLVVLFGILSLFFAHSGFAQTDLAPISPPTISTISKNISNEEIFYIGGKTDTANETILVYLQNLDTGATLTETAESDKSGDWFYRHGTFLTPGSYRIWVQGRIAGELSPPGPQVEITINRTAIQFGSNRLSYEAIYLGIIIVMTLCLIGLIFFIAYHYHHGRRKHKLLLAQVREAEESIRRGFAILKNDIESELTFLKKSTHARVLSTEEQEREKLLMTDLDSVQKYVGKELWDIEHDGQS